MQFEQFASYLFYGFISGTAALAVYRLSELTKSIQDLNVNVARVVERQAADGSRIDRLEDHVYNEPKA